MSNAQAAFVWIFTVASLAVWLMTLVWTLKQGTRKWFYLSLFASLTAFWWVSESLAIRLGKYEYAAFPGWLVLWGGGTPDSSDFALGQLTSFLGMFFTNAQVLVTNCQPAQKSWNVPFPVIALETALLFSFVHVSSLWLKHTGYRTALAAAGISGLMMINVMAVLDPVVSTTQWCGSGSDPGFHGLQLGLWHWFTNDFHVGYWFGVPLVNYVAWFLAAAIFTAVIQLDDEGPRGVVEWFSRWVGPFAPIVIAIAAFLLLLPIKIVVDKVLLYGLPDLAGGSSFDPRVWQFGVVGGLIAVGLILVVAFGQFRQQVRFGMAAAYAQLAVFVFCLVALRYSWDARIAAVWAVTSTIATITIGGPLLFKFRRGASRRVIEAESGIRVR